MTWIVYSGVGPIIEGWGYFIFFYLSEGWCWNSAWQGV